MIQKPVLKKQDLTKMFGPTVLVYTSDFTLQGAQIYNFETDPATGEFIEGTNALLHARNDYVRQTNSIIWESKLLASYGRSRRYLILPSTVFTTIEVESLVEIASRVLDRVMPGRWKYQNQAFLLHYPELWITNSLGIRHKIVDLVMKLGMNDFYLNPNIRGIRFAYTAAELRAGYAHSHMNGNEALQDFCRGGGSPFDQLITSMVDGFSEGKFELFLFQLQSYLEWESVEGKPYKYLVAITENADTDALGDYSETVVESFAEELIKVIDSDLIIMPTGTMGVFEPALNVQKYLEMETRAINGMTARLSLPSFNQAFFDYDPITNQFVVTSSTANVSLPSGVVANTIIQKAFNIIPRVLSDEPTTTNRVLVKRPCDSLRQDAIAKVSELLQNYIKINE